MLNLGSEQVITLDDGRSFRLDKMRLRMIRDFRDWIAGRVGDPFAVAERFVDKLPGPEAMALVKEAEETKQELESFRLLGPLGLRFLLTEEGLTFVVGMLLQRHHPDADDDTREAVADAVGERLVEILQKAQGSVPNGAGPGEAPPAESTGTPSTSGSGTTAPA